MHDQGKLKALADRVFETLAPLWPEAKPLLHYRNGFELLCAVILSAQCTDEQVNRVTPRLFASWPDAKSLAAADPALVESTIHSVGFYKTKARHLVETARILAEEYRGELPSAMADMLKLPGVGRKTANLVLSACFGTPGIIVDTHVLRVGLRLGLGSKANPADMEKRIAELVDPDRRTLFSYALNRHGKYICTARKPACPVCPLASICPRIGLPPLSFSKPGKP
ncbi:MAG: endonuclease III [Rectinemataceae bacterium]